MAFLAGNLRSLTSSCPVSWVVIQLTYALSKIQAVSDGNTSATASGSFSRTSLGPGMSAETSASASASGFLLGAAVADADGSAALGSQKTTVS